MLSVGSNNLSTIFAGVLEESEFGPSSLKKVGRGTLTLESANTYTGGTFVGAGVMLANNLIGSATGTGTVQLSAGTLGGSGTISGAVVLGTGTGRAFLAPGHGSNSPKTLTILGSLTFNADSTYTYAFKAKGKKAKNDRVVTNGITIDSGASFSLSGTAQGMFPEGTVYPVITNTAATPIAGTFSNLPDGAIVTVNGNNLQASYEGGDGNDLTLTVVP